MLKKTLALVALSILTLLANASTISVGALSSNDDGSTDLIVDTLNNREWLRWDVIADLTYAETIAATSSGGVYEEYQIAQLSDFDLFMNALNSGSASGAEYLQLLGNANYDNDWTYALVIDPDNTSSVALLYMTPSGSFSINRAWKTVAGIDGTHSHSGGRDIGYLVYRNVSSVPVPAAAWLFGSALIGLVGIKRKK